MNDSTAIQFLSRNVRIGDWIFEVKSVRALKVDEFGKPYSAIANLTLNGDCGYIDGLLTGDQEEFTKDDYQAFFNLSQQLNLTEVSFDRFKQKRRTTTRIKVPPIGSEQPMLKLIKSSKEITKSLSI